MKMAPICCGWLCAACNRKCRTFSAQLTHPHTPITNTHTILTYIDLQYIVCISYMHTAATVASQMRSPSLPYSHLFFFFSHFALYQKLSAVDFMMTEVS